MQKILMFAVLCGYLLSACGESSDARVSWWVAHVKSHPSDFARVRQELSWDEYDRVRRALIEWEPAFFLSTTLEEKCDEDFIVWVMSTTKIDFVAYVPIHLRTEKMFLTAVEATIHGLNAGGSDDAITDRVLEFYLTLYPREGLARLSETMHYRLTPELCRIAVRGDSAAGWYASGILTEDELRELGWCDPCALPVTP